MLRSVTSPETDGEWATLPLGVLRGERVRPTYSVPLPARWQVPSYFPKTNFKRMSNGMVLRWKQLAWRKVDGSWEGVKTRVVNAAVFDGEALACYFRATQTKNATGDEMSVGDYVVTCDDESATLEAHAEAVSGALEKLCEDRDRLYPGEVACELSELFVTSPYRSKKVWPEAMLALLHTLSRASSEPLICVLKAEPLELAWRERDRHSTWPEAPAIPFPREAALAARRRDALVQLYARELDFERIDEQWMARLVGD